MFDKLMDWWNRERDKPSPHVWTLWDEAERPATGERGERVAGVKRIQARRCVRCGLMEERPLAHGLFEIQPSCVDDEFVDRRHDEA